MISTQNMLLIAGTNIHLILSTEAAESATMVTSYLNHPQGTIPALPAQQVAEVVSVLMLVKSAKVDTLDHLTMECVIVVLKDVIAALISIIVILAKMGFFFTEVFARNVSPIAISAMMRMNAKNVNPDIFRPKVINIVIDARRIVLSAEMKTHA